MHDDSKGNYAAVNGLDIYDEIDGSGDPLILLHGGVGAIEMFGEVLPLLVEGRQVIGVDLQAHGRTADIDRPMTFEAMADDVAAMIEHLGLERADVMGYSLGSGVAWQTAIPKSCASSCSSRHHSSAMAGTLRFLRGWSRWIPRPMKQTPMYQHYSYIAPKPEDWLASTIAPFLDTSEPGPD